MIDLFEYTEEDLLTLEDLFDNSLIGLMILDQYGKTLRVNKMMHALLGVSQYANNSTRIDFSLFLKEVHSFIEILDQTEKDDSVRILKTEILSDDGRSFSVSIYFRALIMNGVFMHNRCYCIPDNSDYIVDNFPDLSSSSVPENMIDDDETEKINRYKLLFDFFNEGPLPVRIVNESAQVLWANLKELELLSLSKDRGLYFNQNIGKFHEHPYELDQVYKSIIGGSYQVAYETNMLDNNGNVQKWQLYSNSRNEFGKHLNSRCFSIPRDYTDNGLTDELNWSRYDDNMF